MRYLIVLLLFLNISIQSEAQLVIKGIIKDDTVSPVAFASASLLLAKDSTLVRGSLTDENGLYRIENIQPGNYRIMASYLGFTNVYSDVFDLKQTNQSATVDINFLQKGILLDETVISAKRPFLEQKSDRLVVNVASSAVAAGGTAMEILQKVPGVVILQERVTIGGSQNLQVWIDGKPSPYTDMNAVLRDMPGDQIEKIELITQPGAQFDASGGPILNIILKRNADLGFKGTAALTTGGFRVNQADVDSGTKGYYRLNPSVNMTYRSGKINLAGNTSYNKGTYFQAFIVDRFIGKEVYKGKNLENSNYIFKNIRIGADYFATDKATFGLVFRTWDRDGGGDGLNRTNVFLQTESVPYNAFITENISDSKRSGLYNNVYYKYEFDKKTGRSFNIDFDYNKFNTRSINNLAIYPAAQIDKRSLSKQDVDQPVNIYVIKTDYKHPVDSTFKFETGLKSSFASVDNKLNFFRSNILSTKESNNFLYRESINAAYINLSKNIKKFDFNAGLRAEQTIISGESMDSLVLDRNYTQLFPSASAIYRLNKNMALQSSYSRRVNRPGFQQQNPFTYFIDSLTYTRGNPALKPEIINTGQINLTYDGQPFFGIAYYKTNDVIIENAPKLEGTRTFTTAENLANQTRLELQLNFPIKIGKVIDGFGGNQAIYNSYNANYQNMEYKASRWHWLAYWQINATLANNFKVEVGGFYMTKFLEEFLTIDNLAGVNLGVSKTFADKKGRIAMSFNDIFYSQNSLATIDFGEVKVNFFQRNFSRQLRLTGSYQFGNTKMKNLGGRNSASESESSRVKIE
ncbi:MAG: TonB-dependent receptor [Saprospiraceae bacterium]|nr:TonB-dependent receptor [Saprospiraceae bacterium]